MSKQNQLKKTSTNLNNPTSLLINNIIYDEQKILQLEAQLKVIEEANLGTVDTLVAKRYLIDKWPQIDIAAEMGWSRCTVSDHVGKIVEKVQKTSCKMGLT